MSYLSLNKRINNIKKKTSYNVTHKKSRTLNQVGLKKKIQIKKKNI